MVRRYIIIGFLAAFFPSCFGAAGPMVKKPTLLLVNEDSLGLSLGGVSQIEQNFKDKVSGIMGETFNIKENRLDALFPRDLRDVNYVLIVCDNNGGLNTLPEPRIEKRLKDAGLDQFKNKVFVVINPFAKGGSTFRGNLSTKFSQLFKDGIYSLDWYSDKFLENVRFDAFLRTLVERAKEGQLSTQVQVLAVPQSLQARINNFYTTVSRMNPWLAQEFFEIITQLQDVVKARE